MSDIGSVGGSIGSVYNNTNTNTNTGSNEYTYDTIVSQNEK